MQLNKSEHNKCNDQKKVHTNKIKTQKYVVHTVESFWKV